MVTEELRMKGGKYIHHKHGVGMSFSQVYVSVKIHKIWICKFSWFKSLWLKFYGPKSGMKIAEDTKY